VPGCAGQNESRWRTEESQTEEGDKRRDEEYSHVAAWDHKGDKQLATTIRRLQPDIVKQTQRSYGKTAANRSYLNINDTIKKASIWNTI
jgi:hypothetical protein